MKSIYSSPFRVYLVFALLGLLGSFSGFKLPISLYPNSSRPTIWVNSSYGHLSAKEFMHEYGNSLGSKLKNISSNNIEVDKVVADYGGSSVGFKVEFSWGVDPKEALKEVDTIINSASALWPQEMRDSLSANFWSNSNGFIAISFFSQDRNPDELFDVLDPILSSKLKSVEDADNPELWNPNKKEVMIELHPEAMALLGLFPKDIKNAISNHLQGFKGGTLKLGDDRLSIEMPRKINKFEDLEHVLIKTPSGRLVQLNEVASIDIGIDSSNQRMFKTNGEKSLILFASPKTGGNVKKMAEDILSIVNNNKTAFPKDVKYKVLVDPSEFIRASIKNVIHEVFLAAGLAVLILFIFIGSVKNTITAAIEIPLSMIMAFILMKVFNMNLNLISLGGLALAAGMNVDASIVVMENIFRHLKSAGNKLTSTEKLEVVTKAVKEVKTPIIASTISTLVVFLPLALTSKLTDAILGDLAKAVVFSHGLSMIIALIIVPTIRLQLMNRSKIVEVPVSPIENQLTSIENKYAEVLKNFITNKYYKWILFGCVTFGLSFSILYLLPKLKKEIIGKPDTDWMILSVKNRSNTLVQQMESDLDIEESKLLEKFGEDISYTFVQVRRANRGTIMARLKDKSKMSEIWKKMEEEFESTPSINYWVGPWNPAELPLPNPPHFRIEITGGSAIDRELISLDLLDKIREENLWPRNWTEPSIWHEENITITPKLERWPYLNQIGVNFSPYDLIDLLRVATEGKFIDDVSIDEKSYPIKINYPRNQISNLEDLNSFPIGVKEKLVPLNSLAEISRQKSSEKFYKENGQDLVLLLGKQNQGEDEKIDSALLKSKKLLKEYKDDLYERLGTKTHPAINIVDSMFELNDALKQLVIALCLSLFLIFFTLIFQFGNIVHTLIIMVAIPLGVLGGIVGLYIFDSTLSLNSVLGIILLNGIAVNNSIILVDFIKSLVNKGIEPLEASVIAARKRLRPILITSLTTVLGMLPIALGSGEGGKVLQPLGIAVTGGLWVSMLFTLFVIPLLEVVYLRRGFIKNKFNENDDIDLSESNNQYEKARKNRVSEEIVSQ